MKIENYMNFTKFRNKKKKPIDCVCTYDGKMYALDNGKRKELYLKDFLMPFKSRHQFFMR
uniref:Uncharacterized protein n=1 Tax=uncultured marine thaumarchaeote KM3_76_D06 TaxID=1456284 RepID=A0A075HS62_9ARCH|nr:hypothetical protein [uncultured marine thaumarchaeote KM3_76_D06]